MTMGRSTVPIDRRGLLMATLGMLAALPRLALAGSLPATEGLTDRSALDEMIGQMIIMGFRGGSTSSPGARAIAGWLRSRLIGGVIFFEDNLPSPQEAKRFTDFFGDAAAPSIPFLCVDQEGGIVSRLRADHGFEPLPSAKAVATMSPQAAEKLYERTATELQRLGFNVNFGPVVDLALNSSNPVIEQLGRSYGADPDTVVEYAKAFVTAHRRHHVLTAIKHFPGHGSTSIDSHQSLPTITGVWREEELRPFAELVKNGYADMVMVGHLVHSELSGPGLPASLSTAAVQTLLRDRLGYDGAVVADDMQMGALRRFFAPDESILRGIEAGINLFIYSNRLYPDPQMPARFHRVIEAAIESGRLPQERIERSVTLLNHLKLSVQSDNASSAR
jgi:beta-N-acetylhexosaminidase